MLNQNYNANSVRPSVNNPEMRRFGRKSCPWIIGAAALASLSLGILVLCFGRDILLRTVVIRKLGIEPGEMLDFWLDPPVETHFTVYAFDVKNADAILKYGDKPVVEEVGPFVFKSKVVKDSDELFWGGGGPDGPTLRYRPRKFLTFVPEKSTHDREITVPNIPLLTEVNGLRGLNEFKRGLGQSILTSVGHGTPFVKVTVQGLLWGYEDEFPCFKMVKPQSCQSGNDSMTDDDSGELFKDTNDEFFKEVDLESMNFDRRKKRDVPQSEFVDCKCYWGLFRDKNGTLREPIEFVTGAQGRRIEDKGLVVRFNDRRRFGYWEPDSECDRVRGQDVSTFPPGISKDKAYEILIPDLCRPLPLVFNGEMSYNGIDVMEFALPPDALGSHNDSDPEQRNLNNRCYCLEEHGYDCYRSGVLNLAPCKRNTGKRPPLTISLPHFYKADPYFANGVVGLNPNPDLHKFYTLLVPELGIPLAIRPRIQMNIVLRKDNQMFKNLVRDEVMLPILWTQDGFDIPSGELMKKVSKGVNLPSLIVNCFGAIAIIGGVVLLGVIFCWFKCRQKRQYVRADHLSNKYPMTRV